MATSTVYNFFATREDILNVLRIVETSYQLQYIECGLFNEPERSVFGRSSSLPALGIAQKGESIREPTFLVMLLGDRLKVGTAQRRGGTKYAVDQEANPGTVTTRPGGVYHESALIAGMVGTVHQDEKAKKLMKAFSSVLGLEFTKVKSYLVGPEAKKLQESGVRLTHSVQAPAAFNPFSVIGLRSPGMVYAGEQQGSLSGARSVP